jgi:hypothetical protein
MRTMFCSLLGIGLVLAGARAGRADEQAEMKALLDKATKALGGKALLTKYKGLTAKGKGKIHVGTNAFAFTEESYWQVPTQYRFDLNLDVMGNSVSEKIILDGTKGWVKIGEQTAKLPKDAFTAFKDVFHAIRLVMRPLDARDKAFKLSGLGEMKIGDRPAVGVKITHKSYPDVDIYLDKESSLPLQAELRSKDDVGGKEVAYTLLFSDYKKFGDLKTYTKLVWKKDGNKYIERETTEIKGEEKLDADLFAKP